MAEREVVHTFARESEAADAMRLLNARGIDDYKLVVVEEGSIDEQETSIFAGPGVGMTGAQGRGAAIGALAGACVLGLLGVVVAFALRALALIGLTAAWTIIVCAIVAGATTGFVYGGRIGGTADATKHEEIQDLRFVLRVRPHDSSEAARAEQILMRRRSA